MAHDLMRGIKNSNFWVMEEQSGPCGLQSMGDTPEPGQIRLWTYQSIAHGAEAIVYFRWRACTFGREQYWYGILDHDGIARRRYREVQQTGKELESLSDLIVGSELKPEVAIIKSYDNLWSHRIYPHNAGFDYNKLLMSYYDALADNNINTDVVSVDWDFSSYRLVVMPAFNLMTERIRVKCEEYVKNGGVLLITFRSGTRTWNNSMTTLTSPREFREMAGVELEEFDSINFGRQVMFTGSGFDGIASIWCDVLKSNGAGTLAEYEGSFYAGKPAITVNFFGDGKVYYVGCDLNGKSMIKLVESIAKTEGIMKVLPEMITGVEAVKKYKDGKTYYMVMNHNNAHVKVPLNGKYTDRITGRRIVDEMELAAYDVAILE